MALPPDILSLIKLKDASFFFYLIRRINETAGPKIIWITDDFHSVTVTQSVSKNLRRSNKILKVSPNVIR